MVKRTVRAHVFVENADLGTDHRGKRYCARCPLAEDHQIHDMPEQAAEVTQVEARKLGERDGD